MAQWFVVTLLVAACALYAAWALMPAAMRRTLAEAALKQSLPEALARKLRPYAKADSGCGCSGCDRAEKPSTSKPMVAPITFHKRR